MQPDNIPLILLIVFVFLLIFLIGNYKWLISRAINNYVIPHLKLKGFVYQGYASVEFFSIGDFTRLTDNDIPGWTYFFRGRGSGAISLYFYVYYKTPAENKRITIRIDTLFFFIRQVKYSGEL